MSRAGYKLERTHGKAYRIPGNVRRIRIVCVRRFKSR